MRAEDIALLGLDDDDMDYAEEEELLGAGFTSPFIRNRGGSSRPVMRAMARRGVTRRVVTRALKQKYPGVSGSVGPKQFPLGFPAIQFVNAGATTLQTQTNPQRPFKGNRLVVVVRATAGATGLLVTIARFDVGANSQLVNAQPIPAEVFQPNSFDVPLAIAEAQPGINVTIDYNISAAPGVGETVDVGTTIIGITLGG